MAYSSSFFPVCIPDLVALCPIVESRSATSEEKKKPFFPEPDSRVPTCHHRAYSDFPSLTYRFLLPLWSHLVGSSSSSHNFLRSRVILSF
jgi:hypothetical protein